MELWEWILTLAISGPVAWVFYHICRDQLLVFRAGNEAPEHPERRAWPAPSRMKCGTVSGP